jgi:prephenate dehydratase
MFPAAIHEPIADTAIGAKWLADGKYADDTAVVCPKSAGEASGLTLIKDGIQDNEKNETTFLLFRLA